MRVAAMISGSTTLKNNFGLARTQLLKHLGETVAETGRDIAQSTRENMTPGHFLDSGLSQDETQWTQLDPLCGAVQVPTEYAAYPEFGTANMAPRPALTPAIMEHWPTTLHRHWEEDDLPPIGPIEPLKAPVSQAGHTNVRQP